MRSPQDGTIIATATDITDREDARMVKEQLIATVSHELRTPLTAIQGSLGLLMALPGMKNHFGRQDKIPSKKQRQNMTKLNKSDLLLEIRSLPTF